MENIIVHGRDTSLNLTFVDAFHPSELNIKAEHWYYRYKLTLLDSSYEFDGWFTGKFWHLEKEEIIVFEEYINEKFNAEIIKEDKDVELRLFLVDFKRNAVAKFSRLSEGRFDVIELTKNKSIVYLKKKHDRIGEFKVSLDSLKFVEINN